MIFRAALCALVAAFLTGCGTTRYLLQATHGQLALAHHARPIAEVLKDERTPRRIKVLLGEIPAIKVFGERQGLRATTNYEEYTRLDRPAAVWVVSASQRLKFEPREWSFPVVGSFTYLGWFSLEGARAFADELRTEGLDVDVRPARAYSTLGWFRDPVLSTMIPAGDEALGEVVNVVLHESVHATLYVKNQSWFNESVAAFVADQLTPVYLRESRGAGAIQLTSYQRTEEAGNRRQNAFRETYAELAKLYSSSLAEDEKLRRKTEILERLKVATGAKRELNNASLIQFRTYGLGQEEFAQLLATCGGSVPRFLAVLARGLPSSAFTSPQQEEFGPLVLALAKRGC